MRDAFQDLWKLMEGKKTLYKDEVLQIFRSDYIYNIFIISCYLLFKMFLNKKIKVDFFSSFRIIFK